jgi:hypothetical protein
VFRDACIVHRDTNKTPGVTELNVAMKCAIGLSLLTAPLMANAALILVNGSALVDNTDNNTMWINDGNSFQTMAQASGDPVTFVQTVIAASSGFVVDTPNAFDTPSSSGRYLLKAADFDAATGRMTWWGAQAWINYLNSIKYQGYADWRLPTITDTASSHFAIGTTPGFTSPSTGELTQLFYEEMGAVEGTTNLLGTLDYNATAFVNLQTSYWYGTESLYVTPTGAWTFAEANGPNPKNSPRSASMALPVRSGQASLIDMVTSIHGSAKTAGIKKPDPSDLVAARSLLKASCDALDAYSKHARAPGAVSSVTTQLAADTEALKAAIGCR